MARYIEAIFDGMVFRPLEPVEDLALYSRVRLAVMPSEITLETVDTGLFRGDELNQDEAEEDPAKANGMGGLDKYVVEHYIYSDFYKR